MKTKNFLVGLTSTVLVIIAAAVANPALAQDAPPSISNPFGTSSGSKQTPANNDAPPSLTMKTPPKTETPKTETPKTEAPKVEPPKTETPPALTTPPPLTPPELVTQQPAIPVIQDFSATEQLPAAPEKGKLPKTGPETGLMFLASMAGSAIWKKFHRKK